MRVHIKNNQSDIQMILKIHILKLNTQVKNLLKVCLKRYWFWKIQSESD